MKRPIACVDVFHGSGPVNLPVPQGIAAAWDWRKAQVGNTHPGACSPFGMVSACAYSGAYPSGYGTCAPSSTGPTPAKYDRKTATGFTHFQHSGTGDIRAFYNYLRVIPLIGAPEPRYRRWNLVNEQAHPGYYATELSDTGIKAELTVAGKTACHRYTFPASNNACIAVDACTGGLFDDEQRRTEPTDLHVEVLSSNAARGRVMMLGIPVCFYAESNLGSCTPLTLTLSPPGGRGNSAGPADGVLFTGATVAGQQVQVRIGFSFRSVEQAQANMETISDKTFDQIAAATRASWCDHLERIQVTGGTDAQRETFYSCLYHSLIKPIDCTNESPYWPDDSPFYLDFATMWDMYKTALPLVFTICPDRASDIVNATLRTMEHHGRFPNAYLIEANFDRFEDQSQALAHHSIVDAWLRGTENVDWSHALRLMARALETHTGPKFMADGKIAPFTHTLDYSNACFAVRLLARALGDSSLEARMDTLVGNWRNVFDPATGLLGTESDYYEGTNWNYSFRPMPEMTARMELAGGRDAFLSLLDRFFGYADIEDGSVDPEPVAFERLLRADRFEGLNNEADMESPCVYALAGRHDRTAEVVRAVMSHQYATGHGGLPGNDDSGGLSSWYVWNAIGLFPVSGQDLYVIGSPLFKSSTLRVRGGEFTVEAPETSDENICVQSAELNGKPLSHAWIRVGDVAAGGRLVLKMGPRPETRNV